MIIHKLDSKVSTGFLSACGYVTPYKNKITIERDIVSCGNCLIRMGRSLKYPTISINNNTEDLREVISKLRRKNERLLKKEELIKEEIANLKKQSESYKEDFEKINQLLLDFIQFPKSEKIIKAQEIIKKHLK